MKRSSMVAAVATTVALCAVGVSAQDYGVVPAEFENVGGTSTFLYMVTTGRTYQMLIHESELTQFVGKNLTGFTWRLPNSATGPWPPADTTFNSFDVYLGPGVAPANRSTTFADNYSGARTQVRSGSLVIPTGSYSSGGAPNAWGFEVTFNDYLYTGGHLTIEIRHTGLLGHTTTRSFDALSTTTSGYGTRFSALWVASFDGTTGGLAGNFFVTRLTFSDIPAPGALALLSAGLAFAGRRRRRA